MYFANPLVSVLSTLGLVKPYCYGAALLGSLLNALDAGEVTILAGWALDLLSSQPQGSPPGLVDPHPVHSQLSFQLKTQRDPFAGFWSAYSLASSSQYPAPNSSSPASLDVDVRL